MLESSRPATQIRNGSGIGFGFGECGSGNSVGYRGNGYNPNFDNADEYPPSRGHVQAPPRRSIDLNALVNKRPRKHYYTHEKQHIYSLILQLNGPGKRLKRGVSSSVAQVAECPRRVVQRIWKEGVKGLGIHAVKCNCFKKCGRKKIKLNIEALEAIPPSERTTLAQVALNMNMSKSTIQRRLKEKEIRRISSELKPALTPQNIKERVVYCLRKRGEWELKPCKSVDKNKSREYLVKYVLPAIKARWPESDRWNTIYIQQDNAKTHIQPNDEVFLREAARGGWDIRMVQQPPNSPDTNINDLGWFASIQSMFQKKMPKTLPEIVQKVEESLAEYEHEKLNRIWLSHQNCMREIIKHKGSIHYDLPHMKKEMLERQGLLPVRLTVDKQIVDDAIEFVNMP
ncbi:hypothetical protein ACQ4PT_025365 [Festuca glaucescens]